MQVPKLFKTTLTVLLVCAISAGVFGAYMTFIGIPKTKARNFYNDGVIAIHSGEIRKGLTYFESAVAAWPEPYIQKELTRLQQLSD